MDMSSACVQILHSNMFGKTLRRVCWLSNVDICASHNEAAVHPVPNTECDCSRGVRPDAYAARKRRWLHRDRLGV